MVWYVIHKTAILFLKKAAANLYLVPLATVPRREILVNQECHYKINGIRMCH